MAEGTSQTAGAVGDGDMAGDMVRVLLAHSRHADVELLARCRGLSNEALDRRFEIGVGTVRGALTHNLGAMRSWSDVFAGRADRAWLGEEGPFSIAELEGLSDEFHSDWARLAMDLPLEEVVERRSGERVRRFVRSHILAHVMTHSVHHRAQVLNMLRHLGVGSESDPLPSCSVTSWAATLSG